MFRSPEPPTAPFGELFPAGEEVAGGESEAEGVEGVEGVVSEEGGEPPAGVEELPDSTLIANFIPVWQWPILGHMKYIGPALLSLIVVLPPVKDCRAFPALQLS